MSEELKVAPIATEELEAARRKLKRKLAAAIIRAMGEADMSYGDIAEKIGRSERSVRSFVQDLIDGRGKSMDAISDIALAMDAEMDVRLVPWRYLPTGGQ